MIKQALQRIGFTNGEIRTYIALLELGSTSTGPLIKKSRISGSKIYEVLDRLQEKGLASSVIKNNVKHFEATAPDKILDYLDEKGKELEKEKTAIRKIIPELTTKQKSGQKSETKVYTGFEGLKTVNEDIIRTLRKGEEWLSMGLTEQPRAWEIHFTHRQKERARKGIKHKHLLNEKYKSLYKKRKKLPHTEYRFLPKEFEMPTSTEIYNNKVAIMILTKENPMAIQIESKEAAASFRKYFYALWKSSTHNAH